jgi:hypothetical protein
MQRTMEITRKPFDYDKFSATTAAAIQLDPTKRANNCRAVFITFEDNAIRYRIDGTDPDINDGHVVVAGANLWMENGLAIERLSMIGYGGTSIVIVTYYH